MSQLKCQDESCTNKVNIKSDSLYCHIHSCRSVISNISDLFQPIKFCNKYTSLTFCDDHRCKIQHDNITCQNEHIKNELFCKKHKCGFHYCKSLIKDPDMSPLHQYCEKHMCTVEDCRKIIITNTIYCSTHLCRRDCPNMALNRHGSCPDHKCIIPDCNSPQKTWTKYCHSHACFYNPTISSQYGDCYSDPNKCCEPSVIVDGEYIQYCKNHSCKISNCKISIERNTNYCAYHSCAPNCKN